MFRFSFIFEIASRFSVRAVIHVWWLNNSHSVTAELVAVNKC